MRLKRIDLFRVFAIYWIIWAHSQFFDGITPATPFAKGIELGVNLTVRWTMQFFFIVAGYFVGAKMAREPEKKFSIAWNYTKKLLLIFVVWSVIYTIEDPQSVLQMARKEPLELFFGGARIHLWFLMAMTLAIWLFAIWPLDKKGYSFLAFGSFLFLIGLLGGSYQVTPIGVDLGFNTRNGIFFSVLFFAIGVLISVKQWRVGPAVAWILFVGGCALFGLESYFLWANWTLLPIRHDYLFASIPYGIGAFFVPFNAKRDTKLDERLAPLAPYVLGVYVSHLLVLDLLQPLGAIFDPILWAFLLPALIFVITLTGVYLLSKTPLQSLVT
jgi:surface polysaccharide O-acyltransferase-like enzyme